MRSSWDEVERTNMNLIINFTEKRGEVELKLMKDKKCINTLTFEFDANLDSALILKILIQSAILFFENLLRG